MKTNNKSLGTAAEEIAAKTLRSEGCSIVERNYRAGRKEVDIIAKKGNIIIFCEVKSRVAGSLHAPWEAVNKNKKAAIIGTARRYWEDRLKPNERAFYTSRFDVISIVFNNGISMKVLEIQHMVDAFDATGF